MFRTALSTATKRFSSQMQQRRNLASCVLYVKTLPLDATAEQMNAMLEQWGPIYETQFLARRPEDHSAVAFVRFYSGDVPSTVEELAALPEPSVAEVQDVTKRCADAMAAINNTTVGENIISASFARANNPDSIQFQARMQLRKASDPVFAARVNQNTKRSRAANNPTSESSMDRYAEGYKAGFKDGLEQAKNA